jgi:hypothetical protein
VNAFRQWLASLKARVLTNPAIRPRFGMMVGIEVRDAQGAVTHRYCSGWNDLATNNFRNFIAALLTPVSGSAIGDISMTTEANVARTIRMYGPSIASNGSHSFNYTGQGNALGPKICLGDGAGSAVTPARTNINLVGQLYEGFTSAASVGTGIVTISAAFSNGSGSTQTIREAGVKLALQNLNNSNLAEDFLCFHDATADTAVPNGSSVTCTYTFALP